VALLSTVSQGLARELAARGVRSVDELLSSFDEGSLAVVRYGDGRRRRRVGGSAGPILRSARVLSRGKEELILMARADLPDPEDCVLFDLEGMPAHLDDLEKIYLWGLKVVANGSSRYLHSAADFGPEGDRQAWEGFLRNAAGLLDDRPTRRFIHWGSYEKSRIENPSVIPSEILVSSRAKSSCHPERSEGSHDGGPRNGVTRNSIVLPIPSYSLKVVEKHLPLSSRAKSSCHPERSEGSPSPRPTANGPWPATSRRPR
jgi:hypothetical protein